VRTGQNVLSKLAASKIQTLDLHHCDDDFLPDPFTTAVVTMVLFIIKTSHSPVLAVVSVESSYHSLSDLFIPKFTLLPSVCTLHYHCFLPPALTSFLSWYLCHKYTPGLSVVRYLPNARRKADGNHYKSSSTPGLECDLVLGKTFLFSRPVVTNLKTFNEK